MITDPNKIIFEAPAADWNEAFPIGGGRLGAMVYGGTDTEILQLNDDSIWYGTKRSRINPSARKKLSEIRRLIDEGKISEAEDLCVTALSGMPDTMSHYEPLGNLYLLFDECGEVTDYRRELDFAKAVVSVTYKRGDVTYKREVFASFSRGVIVYKVTADKHGSISFRTQLARGNITWDKRSFREQVYRNPGYNSRSGSLEPFGEDTTIMTGSTGVDFTGAVKVIPAGGTFELIGNTLIVKDADEAVVLFASGTSLYGDNDPSKVASKLEAACGLGYEEILEEHLADHGSLYDRVELKLPDDQNDVVRLFNFGRYLMIAGSRPGSNPLNLQGIWNKDFDPMWGSKYTININLQMNYWPAQKCALPECELPLFALMDKMTAYGQMTAERMYGCRGFVAHHNTDIFGDCAPQDSCLSSTYWVMGAAWLCLHIYGYYEYTNDIDFLRQHSAKMMLAARFLLDFMVEDDHGRLIVYPTVSPENVYETPEGRPGCICKGASMDAQITRALFEACLKTADVLQLDDGFIDEIREALPKIPAVRVTSDGRIMEWLEEYKELEPGHRHISHLFALFPGHEINDSTPELQKAARKTLSYRLENGGGHTGWSRAWIINMYAALNDGDEAYKHIRLLMEKSLLPNLFDDHPPFQIDGNFGLTAGIANMLVKEEPDGELKVLPALPAAWKSGSVRGLRLKGRRTIDIEWAEDGTCHYQINQV